MAEVLPASGRVGLVDGVERMIKKREIVMMLSAVQLLRRVSGICSNKIGILRHIKMMVTHMWSGGELWKVTGQVYEPNGSFMKGEKEIDA